MQVFNPPSHVPVVMLGPGTFSWVFSPSWQGLVISEHCDAALPSEGSCVSRYDLQQDRAWSNSILLGFDHGMLWGEAKCLPSVSLHS